MTNHFSQTSLVNKISSHQHQVAISGLWNVYGTPNGGYLMAVAAKAMAEFSAHPHPLSVSAYFLDKTEVGEAIVQSECLNAAKSISTLSSSLLQTSPADAKGTELRERIRLTAAFTNFEYLRGESYCEKTAPAIALFEQCKPVQDVAPHLHMFDQFNMVFDPSVSAFKHGNPNQASELNVWLEYRDGSPFDVFSLLMVPDVMPPAIWSRVGASGWVPTIEMTVNVRAVPQTSRLQIRVRTHYLTNSILEEDVEVWDDRGQLLAISRQIAKLRMAK